MIQYQIKLIFWILCVAMTSAVYSQIPTTGVADTTGGEFEEFEDNNDEEIDTLPVRYFFINNPDILLPYVDTTLGWSFYNFDPAQSDKEYVHLGNLGSAARPIFYEISNHPGVKLGIDVYDIYRKEPNGIRMFELGQPLTDLFFSQYDAQENTSFKALFNRKFSKGSGLGIDYQRINHEGLYLDQANLTTNLTSTGWFQNKKKSWHSYFSFIHNKFTLQDNGGIPSLEALNVTGVDQDKNVVSVSLRNAQTVDKQNMWYWKNLYYLSNAKDSSGLAKNKVWAEMNALISTRSNEFIDPDVSSDSTVYLNYWPDSSSIQTYIQRKYQEFELSLNYVTVDTAGSVKNIWKAYGGFQTNQFDLDTVELSRNSFYAGGKFKQYLTKTTSITGNGIIYLGNETSSFSLKGNLSQQLTSKIHLKGTITLSNQIPGIRQELLYLNRRLLHNQKLKNPTALIIEGALTSPDETEQLGIKSSLFNQWIYYNENASVTQSDQAIAMLQVFLKKHFKFGPFRSKLFFAYQIVDQEEVIPLPTLYTRNSLFVEGYLFKQALHFQAGGQFQWNSLYLAPAYMPVINQFYNQGEVEIGNYPALDAIINLRVNTLRAFFRMDNLTNFFSDKYYFQHPYYPYPDPKLRIGIRWILRQ